MSFTVLYEPEALADLKKLSQGNRQRIVTKLIGWLSTLSRSLHSHYPITYPVASN
jgi:mRNA-degrading endonuclease RelE of RelBE toxin-antitoxin system